MTLFISLFGSFLAIILNVSSAFLPPNKTETNLHIIEMQDETFKPREVTLQKGETIQFKNIGKNNHWPASNIHPTHDIYPEFDSKGPILSGNTWTFKFERSGEWRFHDHLNSQLSGIIKVEGNNDTELSKYQKMVDIQESLIDLLSNIKFSLLNSYFYFFPQDINLYLSRQNIAGIIAKSDFAKLEYLINLSGPEKLISLMYDQSGQGKSFNCHSYSHHIGRLSYKILGAQALEKNITLCHSGYHHGVIAAFISQKGTDNLVNNLSKTCDQLKTSFGRLTCYHGSGHGLMAYYDNNLPETIKSCKSLDGKFKQENCLVGAFMENIGSATGDSLNPHKTEWINEDDPQLPCNKIDQDSLVQSTCYAIQPNWMKIIWKNNMEKVVESCLNANLNSISSCFFGYGQEAALSAKFEPLKILDLCQKVPQEENFYGRCLVGAQMVIMDFYGPNLKNQGLEFCNVLSAGNKEACLERLDSRLKDINALHN